jgi:O-antigen/teichoic acid export membrane protein
VNKIYIINYFIYTKLSVILPGFLKIVRKANYLFYFSLTEKFFYFFLFVSLSRFYDNAVYGMVATSFAISNAFALLISFGMPFYIQREVAKTSPERGSNLNIYVSIYAYSSVFYILGVLTVRSLFFNEINILLILLISASIYFLNFSSIFNTVFTGLKEYRLQFKLQFITKLITAFAITISVLLNADIAYILTILFVSSLFYLASVYININNLYVKARIEKTSAAVLIKEVYKIFPLYIASVCNYLYDKIDILIISRVMDYNLVAVYSVAYGFYKSSALFFSFIISDFYTKLSHEEQKTGFRNVLLNRYSLIILIITVICSVLIYIFADFGINLIYSGKFTESAAILKIMSVGVVLMGFNNYTGTILNAFGKFRENMIVTILALAFNIIMNIIFVPLHGLIAAAYITLLTEFIVLGGDTIYILKNFRYRGQAND